MDSTNYYIVHKSGRKVKIVCLGYTHDAEIREGMRKQIARLEHHREKDYSIKTESETEITHDKNGKAQRAAFVL